MLHRRPYTSVGSAAEELSRERAVRVLPPEDAANASSLCRQAELGDRVELLDIDGAGHALLPEQPEKIAAAVIAFARRHQGAR
jgi:pimeloyl-ACP methyl ester carboxylesterase